MVRLVPILLAGVALGVAPALAADQNVTATDSPTDQFSPASVTVSVAESVTWSNAGGSHNVHFDDDSYVQPTSDLGMPWTVSRTFSAARTYRYYCDVHPDNMVGTVTVLPASSSTGPTPTTTPTTPTTPTVPQAVKDSSAPRLRVTIASRQRVRRNAVQLVVASDEEVQLRASGTISVPGQSKVYKFRTVTRKLAPRVETRLKLKLARSARAPVKRALKRGIALRASIRLILEDRAGNLRSAKRSVKLRP